MDYIIYMFCQWLRLSEFTLFSMHIRIMLWPVSMWFSHRFFLSWMSKVMVLVTSSNLFHQINAKPLYGEINVYKGLLECTFITFIIMIIGMPISAYSKLGKTKLECTLLPYTLLPDKATVAYIVSTKCTSNKVLIETSGSMIWWSFQFIHLLLFCIWRANFTIQ